MVLLKQLRSFWKTIEMILINCEINISLTWSEEFIILSRDYGTIANN